MNLEVFRGRRVLVTGHTGFKGTWLYKILDMWGARLDGLALPPQGGFMSSLSFAQNNPLVDDQFVDLRDFGAVKEKIAKFSPEIVFHLAAQPLVKRAYDDPLETFETNVIGTANLLEAIRQEPSVLAAVVVTSDKAYENQEWAWGYRETDQLGGIDPYSSSKAAAEIVFSSYKRSLFNGHGVAIASARAGNVIGGGDWAADRIVPDAVRSVMDEKSLLLRNPNSTRPWQHVLEPISGYLLLAEKLLGAEASSPAYNFGPDSSTTTTVLELVEALFSEFGRGTARLDKSRDRQHEANLLQLNCDLAKQELGWKPRWNTSRTIHETALWYQGFLNGLDMEEITKKQINTYFGDES